MKELTIAENMIALARARKGKGSKRSAMLRMIMPMLSRENGEKLAEAIDQRNSKKFGMCWDAIKKELEEKLNHSRKQKATAASAMVEVCSPGAKVLVQLENADVIEVFRFICSRMCRCEDPCPLPPQRTNPVLTQFEELFQNMFKGNQITS